MAASFTLTRTARRHLTEEDVCPLQAKSLRADKETDRWTQTGITTDTHKEDTTSVTGSAMVGDDTVTMETSDDELGRLDIDLDRKSKRLNLTSSNVRAILHEVITDERVVAMMKAAIRDTQNLPLFEPKIWTRSRLRQTLQPVNWDLSAVNKPPQFIDIELEEDEDSSDEEYCPDEEEEEEDTTEETFLSDADSLASPPRMHQGSQNKSLTHLRTDDYQSCGHLSSPMNSTCTPHLLPALESSFLERLKAVDEELDCSPSYTYGQSLDRKPDDDDDGYCDEGSRSLAYRTRSKRPLVDVPLGQLEAALLPPDITADMYDKHSAQRKEDRHWTKWLQGLMAPDCEDEAEDDDDPEYNFLEDLDEPDREDYRTDRAVQITKKEVNELLEELFETLQEEEEVVAEEEHEEEETPSQLGPKFNVPQALRFEAPLASMLTERRQTVRKQYEAQQQKRALQDTTNHLSSNLKDIPTLPNTITSVLVLPNRVGPTLHLDHSQKLQLKQQLQQHVQLLTQVHLLSCHIAALNHEASITKRYLEELQQFAHYKEEGHASSCFRVCNLQGALDLLQEVEQREEPPPAPPAPLARPSRRWLPQMMPATNSLAFPLLPADTAWLFATRPVFLYPELLPVCSLDPALHSKNLRTVYTAGEDGLIVLGLKHFEGTFQSDELISSYLLSKSRWNFRKHVREMSGPRAPDNVIKTFVTENIIPPLPLACSRVQPEDQQPPVDRDTNSMPNWLKNSQQSIQKTRLDTSYPPSLPPGCTLRLHPNYINKYRPSSRPHRRFFTLAHNESLLPLAKAQEDPTERRVEKQVDLQVIPIPGVTLFSTSSAVSGALPLAPPSICGVVPLTAVHPGPTHLTHADVMQSCLPISQNMLQTVSAQESSTPLPLLLPLSSCPSPSTTNPKMPCSTAVLNSDYFLLQMVRTPPTSSQDALGHHVLGPIRDQQKAAFCEHEKQTEQLKQEEEESMVSLSTVSPTSCTEDEEEKEERPEKEKEQRLEEEKWAVTGVSLNGGENTGREQDQSREGGGRVEGEEGGGAGEGEQGGEEEEGRQRDEGGGERDNSGEKDKDEDQDRQGDDDEEEDFDDLTQDEDEEEVMSSASEESVLSVPELQETMKQLTWLAAERRLCADGDSEEDHSPTSPGSQEEEEEEEEEGPKGEESGVGRSNKAGLDEETPSGEQTPQGGGGRCPGRGRGRSQPHRGLRRSRQERHSKDATKLLLLYDENILDNDPHRESKDMAFAQSYLSRVREALQGVPGQVEVFVSLLNEFEQVGDGQEVILLFRKLCCILGDRTDLLRDFAAFLHPEQALLCGLFEEQQAFERSRRFLRQLEISFGDNPSHYQKIIKALQIGPDLSPTSIQELKAQMSMLLKGHTHLQAEFWVFFDELRPPSACPGQFEEAQYPEDGGGGSEGGEGCGQESVGGTSGGFEEVTLPELEEEEEGHKIQPMTSRRQRRKMDTLRNYKGCDWANKEWSCLCHDAKMRKHKRKGCSRCLGNKTSGSRAMKSLDPLYAQISTAHNEPGDKDLDLKGGDDSPQPDQSGASWEGPFPLTETKEEEEEEEEAEEEEERKKEQSPSVKRSRREEVLQSLPVIPTITAAPSTSFSVAPPYTTASTTSVCTTSPTSSGSCAPSRPAPPPDLPVCAKNISLTASGEKVILWTREADRVILKTCQQEGANQNTFQAISCLLGNKTPSEVSRRFRDLMHLFRTAARQTSSEDEAPPTEPAAANEAED